MLGIFKSRKVKEPPISHEVTALLNANTKLMKRVEDLKKYSTRLEKELMKKNGAPDSRSLDDLLLKQNGGI